MKTIFIPFGKSHSTLNQVISKQRLGDLDNQEDKQPYFFGFKAKPFYVYSLE